jgi:hypothetical protein
MAALAQVSAMASVMARMSLGIGQDGVPLDP